MVRIVSNLWCTGAAHFRKDRHDLGADHVGCHDTDVTTRNTTVRPATREPHPRRSTAGRSRRPDVDLRNRGGAARHLLRHRWRRIGPAVGGERVQPVVRVLHPGLGVAVGPFRPRPPVRRRCRHVRGRERRQRAGPEYRGPRRRPRRRRSRWRRHLFVRRGHPVLRLRRARPFACVRPVRDDRGHRCGARTDAVRAPRRHGRLAAHLRGPGRRAARGARGDPGDRTGTTGRRGGREVRPPRHRPPGAGSARRDGRHRPGRTLGLGQPGGRDVLRARGRAARRVRPRRIATSGSAAGPRTAHPRPVHGPVPRSGGGLVRLRHPAHLLPDLPPVRGRPVFGEGGSGDRAPHDSGRGGTARRRPCGGRRGEPAHGDLDQPGSLDRR